MMKPEAQYLGQRSGVQLPGQALGMTGIMVELLKADMFKYTYK